MIYKVLFYKILNTVKKLFKIYKFVFK